ncbi:AcrR family transcriptional regulator [Actinoplanes campanulatus]|uniref:AcrR family transcriptional regulator n=1 Tax=Actinoplanes campanulatus TaxID=113559 RepID=A0A7W5FGU6_9ACTN|nr:TetR/AcrR family transcriptional regulator [Actinoplanes campanulatus]MBB3097988.1 AcrR family transcriptional regulator [Actinoplanes campanulatus]GGN31753.1 TetR family transcriptional regulator [Actinoplanes campanulatus]GID41376.1 TetR family transcriptional regulator [Actinoplanes campanulatus]
MSNARRARAEQVETTRARILETAERLFAEHGVFTVSSRQISEAAGQGNNAAVGYHFGGKNELVRAIVRRHATPTERIRERLLAEHGGSEQLRDWVTCVVRPITDHLATLGNPSWYARFAAQLMTEPNLRQLAVAEAGSAPTLLAVLDGLHRRLPHLTPEVWQERDDMAHTLIMHFCARRERAMPAGVDSRSVWAATATSLIDALEGLYGAPCQSIQDRN